MEQTLKAIKIDVVKKTVYEVELDGTLEGYYKELECELIEKVTLSRDTDLILDEEGWVSPNAVEGGFYIYGENQSFKGHGLLVGVNGSAWTTHKVDIEKFKQHVIFFAATDYEN